LLYVCRPIFDPFGFSSNGEHTTSPFSLECSYFIGAYALGKPDSPGCWNIFAKAMVKEDLTPDTVRDGAAEPA
jgi:hypothetical protein